MAKMETLRDTFGSGSLDTDKWLAISGATVDQNKVKLTAIKSTFPTTVGVESKTYYDITESYVVAKLEVPVSYFGLANIDFGVNTYPITPPNKAYFSIYNKYVSGEYVYTLAAVVALNSQNSLEVATVAYNSTSHAWLRIRESSGTVYWEVSSDGIKWSIVHSQAADFSGVTFKLVCDVTWNNNVTTVSGSMYLDNVNMPPNPAAFLPFFI